MIKKDDQGQALTEAAIVIPTALLFFMAILQYFYIVQASQLGNYAAFVAARSYAVHGNVDSAVAATNMATQAAAMALAPIARIEPGELFGFGNYVTPLINAVTFNLPQVFQNTGDLLEGYYCALWRLNNTSWLEGGGAIAISTSGSGLSEQVNVNIQYPQPMFMPGLAQLWNMVAGQNFAISMAPLASGLGGVGGEQATIINDFTTISNELSEFGVNLPILEPIEQELLNFTEPYVNIQSKCSIAYESWGNQNPQWRPRLPSTVTDAGPDQSDVDSITNASNTNNIAANTSAYTNAVAQEYTACQNMCSAQSALNQQTPGTAAYTNAQNTLATDTTIYNNASTAVDNAAQNMGSVFGATTSSNPGCNCNTQ
jgi:hypothetical protein